MIVGRRSEVWSIGGWVVVKRVGGGDTEVGRLMANVQEGSQHHWGVWGMVIRVACRGVGD